MVRKFQQLLIWTLKPQSRDKEIGDKHDLIIIKTRTIMKGTIDEIRIWCPMSCKEIQIDEWILILTVEYWLLTMEYWLLTVEYWLLTIDF